MCLRGRGRGGVSVVWVPVLFCFVVDVFVTVVTVVTAWSVRCCVLFLLSGVLSDS